MRILGIIVLVLGVLALAYGGFTYTTEETAAEIGPLELNVERQNRVNVPLWVGVAGVIAGIAMIALGGSRPRQPE